MGRIERSGVRGGGLAVAGLLSLGLFASGCGGPASSASEESIPPVDVPSRSQSTPGSQGGHGGGFGDEGQHTYPVDVGRAWDVTRTSDGGLVIAGAGIRDGRSAILVLKFTPEGRLDSSFGTDGTTWIDAGGLGSEASRVAIDGSERIVVGGTVELEVGGRAMLIARLQPGGTPDDSFGMDGLAMHDATPVEDRVFAMTLDDPGAVIVGGTCGGVACLARFTPDGALDAHFGTAGTTAVIGGTNGAVLDVTRDAGDRLLAGGVADGKAFVARRLANGEADTAFAHGGARTDGWGEVHAVTEQADGRVLTAGSDFLVRRFHADGSPDTDFAEDGVAYAGGSLGRARDLVALPGGGILVFGWGDPGDEAPHTDFIATRLDADGWFDDDFGWAGRLTVDFDGGMDVGLAMAHGPEDAILFGTTTHPGGESLALARIPL